MDVETSVDPTIYSTPASSHPKLTESLQKDGDGFPLMIKFPFSALTVIELAISHIILEHSDYVAEVNRGVVDDDKSTLLELKAALVTRHPIQCLFTLTFTMVCQGCSQHSMRGCGCQMERKREPETNFETLFWC
jgi:hypothetical protein